MRRKSKFVLGLTLCLMLTGCGGSGGSDAKSTGVMMENNSVDTSFGGYDDDAAFSYDAGAGFSTTESIAEDSYDMTGSSVEESEAEGSGSGDTLKTGKIDTSKLVYRGSINVETLDFDDSVDRFNEAVKAFDGFVENMNVYDSNGGGYYYEENREHRYNLSALVRIPSDKYDAFMNGAESFGNVTSTSSSVENISQRYSTAETTRDIYRTKFDRYLKMLAQAESVEDMIEIERELTNIEVNLAQYNTDLSVMDTDVAYSYVDVYIQEVVKYEKVYDDSTFFSRLKDTIGDSWDNFLGFLEGVLFWLILYWWYIVIIIIIVVIVKKVHKKKHPDSKHTIHLGKLFGKHVGKKNSDEVTDSSSESNE